MDAVAAEWVDGEVVVTVKYKYDTWCCTGGAHELTNATEAVYNLVSKYEDSFYDPYKDAEWPLEPDY